MSYLYSSDFGQTWTPYQFLSSPDSILSDEADIAGDDYGNLYTVWRDFKYGGNYDGTIMFRRSTNYGQDWFEEQRLTPNPTGVFPQVANDGPFVIAVWGTTLFLGNEISVRLSNDRGESFLPREVISSGQNPTVDISSFNIHIAYAFRSQVGDTTQIFYRRGKIITTGVTEDPYFPFKFTLFQNYPNPFNPETEIRFEIPGQARNDISLITLKVYDVLGREVATLVDEVKQPGQHNVVWNAGNLPSGVYFYKLQTPNFYAVKKSLLLK